MAVDRQLVAATAGEPVLGPPKTAKSFRIVPLADVAVDELAAHLSVHGSSDQGLVLHDSGRAVARPMFGRVWRKVRERADLPAARFHDTRHTFASMWLSGGVSVAAAADYLGHSPGMLLKTYAHLMPADHDRARSVVQAAFTRAAEDSVRTATSA